MIIFYLLLLKHYWFIKEVLCIVYLDTPFISDYVLIRKSSLVQATDLEYELFSKDLDFSDQISGNA